MSYKILLCKRIMVGISLFLYFSCNNKPTGIVTITSEEIRNMIPANFYINENYQKISVNDTFKLSYIENQFLMKNQMSDDEKGYTTISDTIFERILRRFKELEVSPNRYKIKYEIIDLNSDEIPSTLGGNNNRNLVSRPFSLVSYKSNYLTEEEKDSLKKSLFSAFN